MVDSTRGSRVAGLRAEHAPGRPGRVHRRGLGADADRARRRTASCSATPSAASCSARPTGRWQLKVPAALAAGLVPILCVGETEEEREPATPSASCATRSRRTSRSVATERLGEVVIAYEPIWAIGTGQVATPEQAQEAIAFIRALVADRAREQAERAGSSTAAASSPRTPPSCSRCPTSTARWSAAQPRRRVVRGDRRGRRADGASPPVPASCPCRAAAWSCSTAGGSRPTARATRSSLADTPVFDELWARYPHTQLTACGRAVGLPEGQMGNSEVGHLNLGAGAVISRT